MNRLLGLMAVAALFWAAIVYFFGDFLSRAETIQFVAVWSGLTLIAAGVIAALVLTGARLMQGQWPARPEIWALIIWIPLAAWLAHFIISLRPLIVDFQGITNLSSCKQALSVVMDNEFAPAETEPDIETDGTWYVFDSKESPGSLEITVRCRNERLLSVSSAALPEIPVEERLESIDVHRAMLDSLAQDYGETDIVPIPNGYGSRWCFSDDLPDSWRRRMFLVEDETAEIYVITRQDDPTVEEFRIETGLLLASAACEARES